jgi:two-component system, chemotaxis family, response regulator Rcp1
LAYSSVYTPAMSILEPALDLPSASELWNVIMAGSGSSPNPEKDRLSVSRSRPDEAGQDVCDILIVEDSKTDVFLIQDALKSAQVVANVHVVRDGYAATNFFDAADADPNAPCPALVLLDLNLPKKTGAEVLRHLRESSRCQAAQVLIISSSDSARDRASLEHLGAAGYFKKPTEYEAFMKLGPIVEALLDKPEQSNQ